MVIGGRITPSFTSNWLTRQGSEKRPAPLGRFDIGSIALAALALVSWIAAPGWYGTAALLLLMATVQSCACRAGPVSGLGVNRSCLCCMSAMFSCRSAPRCYHFDTLAGNVPSSGALHAWTTGAMGTMTLAVMTRATLGHTGRDVTSTPANMAIYAAIIAAALMRVAAPLLPTLYYPALLVAAACWLLAFGIFLLIYGPMLFWAKTGA